MGLFDQEEYQKAKTAMVERKGCREVGISILFFFFFFFLFVFCFQTLGVKLEAPSNVTFRINIGKYISIK